MLVGGGPRPNQSAVGFGLGERRRKPKCFIRPMMVINGQCSHPVIVPSARGDGDVGLPKGEAARLLPSRNP